MPPVPSLAVCNGAMPTHERRLLKLESLRGMAAIYVAISHFVQYRYFACWWAWPLRFGQEAVILFFVLSGFVIYYSTFADRANPTFRDYFIKRARRIYPLFLIAMAVAYASECMVQHRWLPVTGRVLLANLFMLQDWQGIKAGVWFPSFYNPPLWSLSYEWWFYMMFFPIQRCIAPAGQKYLVAGLSIAATLAYQIAPNQISLFLSYFVIWWAGVEMARQYDRSGTVTFGAQRPMLAILAIVSVLWLTPMPRVFHWEPAAWTYPIKQSRHFVSSLLIVGAGLLWQRVGWAGFRWTLAPFRYVAPISYAIYIFHAPLIRAIHGIIPRNRPAVIILLCATIPLLWSCLMEGILQKLINRWTSPLLIRRPPEQVPSAIVQPHRCSCHRPRTRSNLTACDHVTRRPG